METLHILATKKLSTSQQKMLSSRAIKLSMYNAISIDPILFEYPKVAENAIITSQNTVRFICDLKIAIKHVFCVGDKTKKMLVENGYNVVKTAENGQELANYIAKNNRTTSFVFFCGKKRRDEIPSILLENTISFKEVTLYYTKLNHQKFNQKFDGILFFSPSAIQSYVAHNSLAKTPVFCIGNTTASEARKHTSNLVVAPKATIESTIATLLNFFRS